MMVAKTGSRLGGSGARAGSGMRGTDRLVYLRIHILLLIFLLLSASHNCAPENTVPPSDSGGMGMQGGSSDDGGSLPDENGSPSDEDVGDEPSGPEPPQVVGTTTSGADIFFPGCFVCEEGAERAALVEVTEAFIDPAFDDLAIVLTNHSTECIRVRLLLGRGGSAGQDQSCEAMYLTTAEADPLDATLVFIEQASALQLNGAVVVDDVIVESDLTTPSACERCAAPGGPLGCCEN